jgi:hypothetical protein
MFAKGGPLEIVKATWSEPRKLARTTAAAALKMLWVEG